jgi:hypothetical protein
MLAASAASQWPSDPLSGLVIGQRPDPVLARSGWSVVELRRVGATGRGRDGSSVDNFDSEADVGYL